MVDFVVNTCPCRGTIVFQDDLLAHITAQPEHFWTVTGIDLIYLNLRPVDLNFPSSKL